MMAYYGRYKTIGEVDMNWEQRFCPNQDCAVDSWLVQQISGHHELWELHDRFSDGAFTIAATDPVCPRCGSTLVLLEDLAQHNNGAFETEQVLLTEDHAWPPATGPAPSASRSLTRAGSPNKH